MSCSRVPLVTPSCQTFKIISKFRAALCCSERSCNKIQHVLRSTIALPCIFECRTYSVDLMKCICAFATFLNCQLPEIYMMCVKCFIFVLEHHLWDPKPLMSVTAALLWVLQFSCWLGIDKLLCMACGDKVSILQLPLVKSKRHCMPADPKLPDFQGNFQQLLKKSRYTRLNQEVLDVIVRWLAPRMMVCSRPEQAEDLYHDATFLPGASTEHHMLTQHGLQVNGPLYPRYECS